MRERVRKVWHRGRAAGVVWCVVWLSGMLNELELLWLRRRLRQRRLLRAKLLLPRRLVHPPVRQRVCVRGALRRRRSLCRKIQCRDHRGRKLR